MKLDIKEQMASELGTIGEAYDRNWAVIGRAIIHTVLSEGIVHEILAGVDIDAPGRPKRYRGMYHFQGKQLSAPAISDITGIPANLIRRRLEFGWPLEKAATAPVGKSRFKRKEAAE